MAALIDAIDIKRKMFFELDGTPFHCLDLKVNTLMTVEGQKNAASEDAAVQTVMLRD